MSGLPPFPRANSGDGEHSCQLATLLAADLRRVSLWAAAMRGTGMVTRWQKCRALRAFEGGRQSEALYARSADLRCWAAEPRGTSGGAAELDAGAARSQIQGPGVMVPVRP